MGGISDHCRVAGLEPGLEAYRSRERGLEELERLLDDRLHVHRLTLTQPAAAEAENAID